MARADTGSEYRNGILTFFDRDNYETVEVLAPCKLFEDFTNPYGVVTSVTGELNFTAVDSGTWVITPASGGVARITTSATGTDNDDAELTSELTWYPGKYCAMEARIKVNGVTTGVNVGFSDATGEAADKIALTYSGTTLTSNASNCALFFSDYDSTSNEIRCAAVNDDTDGTVTDSGTAFAINTWHIYRVEINPDGDCDFWLDGVHIYQESAGINTSGALCAYIGLIDRSAESESLDIDYLRVWQKR